MFKCSVEAAKMKMLAAGKEKLRLPLVTPLHNLKVAKYTEGGHRAGKWKRPPSHVSEGGNQKQALRGTGDSTASKVLAWAALTRVPS